MILEILILTLILSILFGINNASVCQAGIVSSGFFTFGRSSLIIGLGLITGAILEGWKTRTFISKIYGVGSYSTVILLISVLVLLIFTFYKIPVSVAHVVAGGWLGIAFGTFKQPISLLINLVLAWSLAPLISLIIAILLYLFIRSMVKEWPLPKLVRFNGIALVLASFYTSYNLGSNNIGLIMGVANLNPQFSILIAVGILVGSVFLSKKFVKAIGEDFLVVGPLGVLSSLLSGSFMVWVLTQFGFPGSLTNGILGALVGIGIVSKPRVINISKLYTIVGSWIFGGLIGFFFSFLTMKII